MKLPLIRQGEGPAAALARLQEEREAEQRKLDRIFRLASDIPDTPRAARKLIGNRSPAGDEKRLRGIPAIGRGVSGHIPGTRP